MFLLDLAVPYRYLELRGDAEITPDDDYSFADQLGAKYQADLRSRDHPGESRVKVTIPPPASTPSTCAATLADTLTRSTSGLAPALRTTAVCHSVDRACMTIR